MADDCIKINENTLGITKHIPKQELLEQKASLQKQLDEVDAQLELLKKT